MIILLAEALYQCPIESLALLIDFNDCSSSWNRLMFYVSALQSYVVYSTERFCDDSCKLCVPQPVYQRTLVCCPTQYARTVGGSSLPGCRGIAIIAQECRPTFLLAENAEIPDNVCTSVYPTYVRFFSAPLSRRLVYHSSSCPWPTPPSVTRLLSPCLLESTGSASTGETSNM